MKYSTFESEIRKWASSYWEDKVAIQTPYGQTIKPELVFEGGNDPNPKDRSAYWGRLTIEPDYTFQSAFSNHAGENYSRKFTSEGFVFVQLFAPRNEPNSFFYLAPFAELVQEMFLTDRIECVLFRNASINKLPPEDAYHRYIVRSEYTFDERKGVLQ